MATGKYSFVIEGAKLLSAIVQAAFHGECEDAPEPVKLLMAKAKGGDVEAAALLSLLGIKAAYVILEQVGVRDVLKQADAGDVPAP